MSIDNYLSKVNRFRRPLGCLPVTASVAARQLRALGSDRAGTDEHRGTHCPILRRFTGSRLFVQVSGTPAHVLRRTQRSSEILHGSNTAHPPVIPWSVSSLKIRQRTLRRLRDEIDVDALVELASGPGIGSVVPRLMCVRAEQSSPSRGNTLRTRPRRSSRMPEIRPSPSAVAMSTRCHRNRCRPR